MESKVVASLLSSLVSKALLLLFLFPPLSLSSTTSASAAPLLLHLLSLSSAALASPPRKRMRLQEPEDRHEPDSSSTVSDPISPSPRPLSAEPDTFRQSFLMSPSTFEFLSGLLEPLLDCCDSPVGPLIRPTSRLAIALCRLATACPYPDLARRFGVSEPAARFCTKRLCRVLCTNFRFWLAFPSAPCDLQSISSSFEALGGLPDCCGSMTSARFRISDGTDVIAQVVSDSSSRILNIAASSWGGKADCLRAMRCSSIYKDASVGRILRPPLYLVGAEEYPLLPWLMVPYADPMPGSKEEDFNEAHRTMLRSAYRIMSSLRNWGILSGSVVDEDRKMAVACIGTCATLHNLLLMRGDHSVLSDDIDERLLLDLESTARCLDDAGLGEGRDACDIRRSLAQRVCRSMSPQSSMLENPRTRSRCSNIQGKGKLTSRYTCKTILTNKHKGLICT